MDREGIEPSTSPLRTWRYTPKPSALKSIISNQCIFIWSTNIASKLTHIVMTYDSVIVGSHVITSVGMVEKNIVIDDGKIVKLTSSDLPSCDKKINCQGLVSIPGVIAVSYTHLTLPTILLV